MILYYHNSFLVLGANRLAESQKEPWDRYKDRGHSIIRRKKSGVGSSNENKESSSYKHALSFPSSHYFAYFTKNSFYLRNGLTDYVEILWKTFLSPVLVCSFRIVSLDFSINKNNKPQQMVEGIDTLILYSLNNLSGQLQIGQHIVSSVY